MSPLRPKTSPKTSPKPSSVLTALALALVLPVLAAAPAAAEVPEGWSEPASVSAMQLLIVLGALPLALFLVILALVYVPAIARGERVTPGAPAVENQWIGGPRKSAGELAAPDDEDSQAGGASARW